MKGVPAPVFGVGAFCNCVAMINNVMTRTQGSDRGPESKWGCRAEKAPPCVYGAMQGNPRMDDEESPYEWQPCALILPRIALFLNRDGMRTRLLLPGSYLVRMSRSMNKPIYRRRPSQEWDN